MVPKKFVSKFKFLQALYPCPWFQGFKTLLGLPEVKMAGRPEIDKKKT